MEKGPEAPTPEPMTPEERRVAAQIDGSGASNFVATNGAPIGHEDFPTRHSAPQPRKTRRGAPRQNDDALDEVVPQGEQNPQYVTKTDEEVATQRAINSRGRPKAGVGAAEAKRRSLEASFERGDINELTLKALKRKNGLE